MTAMCASLLMRFAKRIACQAAAAAAAAAA